MKHLREGDEIGGCSPKMEHVHFPFYFLFLNNGIFYLNLLEKNKKKLVVILISFILFSTHLFAHVLR